MGDGRSAVAKPSRPHENRWSACKKADAVVRLLRGESLEELSREVRVEARRLREAERKIGVLTMESEVLRAVARKRGLQIPPRKPSR